MCRCMRGFWWCVAMWATVNVGVHMQASWWHVQERVTMVVGERMACTLERLW